MKQSKLKRSRLCQHCRREVWGDAEKLRDHVALHRFVQRTGLSVAEGGIITRSQLVTKGGERSGNSAK